MSDIMYPLQHTYFLMLTLICDYKATSNITSACERSLLTLRPLKTWCRAIMAEDRLCELAMLHVHHNDTVGHVNPKAVLKRWDSSVNRKI